MGTAARTACSADRSHSNARDLGRHRERVAAGRAERRRGGHSRRHAQTILFLRLLAVRAGARKRRQYLDPLARRLTAANSYVSLAQAPPLPVRLAQGQGTDDALIQTYSGTGGSGAGPLGGRGGVTAAQGADRVPEVLCLSATETGGAARRAGTVRRRRGNAGGAVAFGGEETRGRPREAITRPAVSRPGAAPGAAHPSAMAPSRRPGWRPITHMANVNPGRRLIIEWTARWPCRAACGFGFPAVAAAGCRRCVSSRSSR